MASNRWSHLGTRSVEHEAGRMTVDGHKSAWRESGCVSIKSPAGRIVSREMVQRSASSGHGGEFPRGNQWQNSGLLLMGKNNQNIPADRRRGQRRGGPAVVRAGDS